MPPCYGPNGPPSQSSEYYNQRSTQKFIEYTNNTAALLDSISEEIDEKVELAKKIETVDHELSDYVTDKLCSILTKALSDKELLEKINSSKYAMQIGIWWEDHQKLDKLNKLKDGI